MYTLAIIDDEPLIQLGIHSLVHYQELSLSPCDFVHTGQDALALIYNQKPDIVLLDISLPGIDGLNIIQQVQQTADALPIFILLTNMDDFSYVQAALRLGVLDFITKIEVTEDVLNAALQKAICKIASSKTNASTKELSSSPSFRNTKNIFFSKLLNDSYSNHPEENLKKELTQYGFLNPIYTSIYFRLTNISAEQHPNNALHSRTH